MVNEGSDYGNHHMNRICFFLAKLGTTPNLAPNTNVKKGFFKCLKPITNVIERKTK